MWIFQNNQGTIYKVFEEDFKDLQLEKIPKFQKKKGLQGRIYSCSCYSHYAYTRIVRKLFRLRFE